MDKFEQYFLNTSAEDLRHHKAQVRKVKQDTANLLRAESKRLIERGF